MEPSGTRDGKLRQRLIEELLAEVDSIACAIREQIQSELPTYESVPPEAFEREIGVQIHRVLESIGEAGDTAMAEAIDLAEIGGARAQQGIPIDQMLRAWRIGVQIVIGRTRDAGGRLGIDPTEVLELVSSTLAMSDHAMLKTAEGHRHAELELARQDSEQRAVFVQAVLSGRLTSADAWVQAPAYGLDPSREFVTIRGRAGEGTPRHKFERALGFHESARHRRGLATVIEGDLAGFLLEAPAGEIPGVVGIGPLRPLGALADSFRMATRALNTAESFGLEGPHDLRSLGLRSAIAADRDLGESLTKRYLEPLAATGSSEEIISSLRVYFASEMNIARAAEALIIHPNTLRYRIGRFEELLDTSLRDPVVAFEVWWALEHAAMRPAEGREIDPAP